MLQKLLIKNYQSHKDSTLEFTDGINVIVGSSDSGKSAILRAIRWIIFNRPLGSNYIRKGEDECHVQLENARGKVSRSKGKISQYIINGDIFKAIGTDVPDSIRDVVNIHDINIQKQLDSHFLVLGSGGEIASKLMNLFPTVIVK
jgi:exonuclease SbcC